MKVSLLVFVLIGGLICIAFVSAATLPRKGNRNGGAKKGGAKNGGAKNGGAKNGGAKNGALKNKRQTEDESPTTYDLPSGVELVITEEITEDFSCDGREYGYYADMSNACQIFHICVPPNRMYSFFCANQTVFDQRSLICVHPNEAPPCEESEQYYVVNQNFGVTDESQLITFA